MAGSLEKAIGTIVRAVEPEKIILFGPRATADSHSQSDYDICVINKGIKHRRKVAQQIYRQLDGAGVPVDIILETPERFDELKNNPLRIYREIAQRGRVLYEKSDPR
jgi:predicted nucleotidyltransferase